MSISLPKRKSISNAEMLFLLAKIGFCPAPSPLWKSFLWKWERQGGRRGLRSERCSNPRPCSKNSLKTNPIGSLWPRFPKPERASVSDFLQKDRRSQLAWPAWKQWGLSLHSAWLSQKPESRCPSIDNDKNWHWFPSFWQEPDRMMLTAVP